MAKNGDVQDIDQGYKKFAKAVEKQRLRGPDVAVGLMGSAAEAILEDTASTKFGVSLEATLTVAALGAIHEFGVDEPPVRIPERSWLRAPFDANRRKYQRILEKLMRSTFMGGGNMPLERALGIVGLQAEEDMRAAIRAHINPPLAASTINARRRKDGKTSDTPLLDTGQLIQAITSMVIPNGEKVAL